MSEGASSSSSSSSEVPKLSTQDSLYSVDESKLASLRSSKPWMKDPKFLKKVKIGPSVAMKMLQHTYSGVDKGIKGGGKPIEVMGLLLGRPHPDDPSVLVVTDAFPLPIEGFETRVIADDQDVVNYMISLGETIEETRKERFMGWYHSHPFDVDENHSHCYLSNTDLSTQLQWQRSEDNHGNPWLAIVVDPLRSLAKGHPEFSAFRAYPPEYTAPANETPDGSIVTDDKKRVEHWGACWNRYYKLDIEYFMSTQAKAVIGILSKNYLWMRTLGSTPMNEPENKDRVSERIMNNVTAKLESEEVSKRGNYSGASAQEDPLAKPVQAAEGLAVEMCEAQMTQMAKKVLFG